MEKLVSNETIKEYLETNNIPTDDITDDDIDQLYNSYLNYILKTASINLDGQERTITDISLKKFNFPNYLLRDYPLKEITEIQIDNQIIPPTDYLVDLDNGIIRWKLRDITGEVLKIKYKTIISDEILDLIATILLDMIAYHSDQSDTKDIKTLKEGDVSITYDTDNSTSNRIYRNLDDLKNLYLYTPLSRMIR